MLERISKAFKNQVPFFVGIPALLWQVLFFLVPLLFILVLSFMHVNVEGAYDALTFEHYVALWSSTYLSVIIRSFFLALLNTFLCVIVAYPMAYYLAVGVQRFKLFWLFLLLLPFWTNFLLHVYAWFFVLERSGIVNTLLISIGIINQPLELLNSIPAVLLVMFYCYLPFMILPLYSILEKLDLSLLEASADLGASHWQTFFRVTLPITLPGLQLGFFLVFVPSFGEFAVPALIGGDKIAFVGSIISYLFLEGGNQPLACAYTMVSILCIIIVAVGFYKISRYFVYGRQ